MLWSHGEIERVVHCDMVIALHIQRWGGNTCIEEKLALRNSRGSIVYSLPWTAGAR